LRHRHSHADTLIVVYEAGKAANAGLKAMSPTRCARAPACAWPVKTASSRPSKGLRNTSASLMLASGLPVHVVAAWHGHDSAVSLSIDSDAQRDDPRAAGAALFG
jgi:hypothetical protein